MHTGRDVVLERRVRPLVRYSPAEPIQHAVGVRTPCDRHGCRTDCIFEDQVPSDDPSDKFTHRRVRIGVGATSDRNHGREFGIAESRECAAHTCNHKREHNRRPGAVRNRGRSSNKQAGANDCANAQHHQISRTEGALERVFADFLRFAHQAIKGLSRE